MSNRPSPFHGMKRELKLAEAIGKTLRSVEFSTTVSQAVLVFDDGFTTLGMSYGADLHDDEIVEDCLAVFDFGDDKLIRAGIVTAEELASMRASRDRELREEQEAREREALDRLKRKFGAT